MLTTPKIISRLISLWMLVISASIYIEFHSTIGENPFFNIGPSPKLSVIGIYIDNYPLYYCFVAYCIANTFVRSVNNNIILPYITLEIQGEKNPKSAYEIVLFSTIYHWFDWIIYINMLLSQIDFVIVEMLSDIIMNHIITYWYIHINKPSLIEHHNIEQHNIEQHPDVWTSTHCLTECNV